MQSRTLSITIEWPDLPQGPVDDLRPYSDRLERRRAHVTAVLNSVVNIVRVSMDNDPDVHVRTEQSG